MRAPVERRDEPLVRVLRGDNGPASHTDADSLLARAEAHGLAGLVHARIASTVSPAKSDVVGMREAARELDHAAHLSLLARIDEVLTAHAVPAIALKGPLLAERVYRQPSTRVTSDIDLLVNESDLERALLALRRLGYAHHNDATEKRFRAEHHHLHVTHAALLPIELHFHAYRGFGQTLRSEPLLARKLSFGSLRTLGVLSRPDEVVYLAVHAAAHRFARISWLYELGLLVSATDPSELTLARERAEELGFARVLAFAVDLLAELVGSDPGALERLRPTRLRPRRSRVARSLVREPASSAGRALTRFLYTLALCDGPAASARYSRSAIVGQLHRLRGIG